VSKNSTAAPPQRITTSPDATTAGRQAGQTFAQSLARPPPHARRSLTRAPPAKAAVPLPRQSHHQTCLQQQLEGQIRASSPSPRSTDHRGCTTTAAGARRSIVTGEHYHRSLGSRPPPHHAKLDEPVGQSRRARCRHCSGQAVIPEAT
jgi:hypothetical protein